MDERFNKLMLDTWAFAKTSNIHACIHKHETDLNFLILGEEKRHKQTVGIQQMVIWIKQANLSSPMSCRALLGFFPSSRLETFPSLCGGFFPHRLGFDRRSLSFLPHLRCEKVAAAHPWSHSTFLSPLFPVPPPTITTVSLPSTFGVRYHHWSTDTSSLFHHVQVMQTVMDPDFTPPPPNYRLLLCNLVGVSSLTGGFFLPPQPHRRFLTGPSPAQCPLKLSPTTVMSSSLVERPPPEPLPPGKVTTLMRAIGIPSPRCSSPEHPSAPSPTDLGPKRPPPKPPDVVKRIKFGNVVAVGASVDFFLCRLVLRLGWVKSALVMFDGKPQKNWAFWNNIVCAEPYEADANFCILSLYQLASEQGVNVNNLETTFSRNVPEEDKEMIRNWIGEKTVDSHFYVVIDRVRKLLIGRQLGSSYWFGYVPLASDQSMCNVAQVLVGLAVRGDSKMWMGNASTQFAHSVCADFYFI